MSTQPTNDGPDRTAPTKKRFVAIAFGVAGVVVAVALALVYTSNATTTKVATHAGDLHWTNDALGTSALARAANAQAVFFAVDHEIGVASSEAVDRSLAEARKALSAVDTTLEDENASAAVDQAVLDSIVSFTNSAREVTRLIEEGEVAAALDLNSSQLEERYQVAQTALEEAQEEIENQIAATDSMAGRIATISQLLVTLLIPAGALVAYRFIVRRQLRERRVEMDARLTAERQLNEAKDEFIASLSHEFRTPLTSIFGFSEVLLENELIDPESSMELIGLINSESAELSRMVEDLLIAARIEADALSVDIGQVSFAREVEGIVDLWQRAGTPISVDVPEVKVLADPLRLRQVLRNLTSNAVKHGGENIAVMAKVEGTRLNCSVVDDGPGVPEELANRLFDRFVHRGRQALVAGSVGLGLNIARDLMEAMGGRLRYERRGDLTVFRFDLSLAEPVSAPAAQLEPTQLQPV